MEFLQGEATEQVYYNQKSHVWNQYVMHISTCLQIMHYGKTILRSKHSIVEELCKNVTTVLLLSCLLAERPRKCFFYI